MSYRKKKYDSDEDDFEDDDSEEDSQETGGADVPEYFLENAKSGRSACNICGSKIGAGEKRVGETIPANDYRPYPQTKYFHVACMQSNIHQYPHCHVVKGGGAAPVVSKSPKAATAATTFAATPTTFVGTLTPSIVLGSNAVQQATPTVAYGSYNNCGCCGAWVGNTPGKWQCTKCPSFSLCSNCESLGEKWVHCAKYGDHPFTCIGR